MTQDDYGLIELLLVFGGVLAFAVRELVVTRRDLKKSKRNDN